MARSGLPVMLSVMVLGCLSVEAQAPPPRTDNDLILKDRAETWIPRPRLEGEPPIYLVEPETARPSEDSTIGDAADPIIGDATNDPNAQSRTGSSSPTVRGAANGPDDHCWPVIHTPAFVDLFSEAQRQFGQKDLVSAIATAKRTEKVAIGRNEKMAIGMLRWMAGRLAGSKPDELEALTMVLALGCGLDPVIRAELEAEAEAFRRGLPSTTSRYPGR